MIKIIPDKLSYNNFEWRIISECDKACSYCIESANITRGKVKEFSNDMLLNQIRIKDFLKTQSGNIEFCGGEPSQHPKAIEWFNELQGPGKNIYFVTHGDLKQIDLEKFKNIDNHLITITYHPTQVIFLDWLEKVKFLASKMNVVVTCVVPQNPKKHKQLYDELILIKQYVDIQLKLELINNEVIYDNINRFKDLMNHSKYFYNNTDKNVQSIFIDKDKKFINDNTLTSNLPIPKNTFCQNKMYGIFDNVLQASCAQGKSLYITPSTSTDDILKLLDSNTIHCENSFCSQQYQHNTINIFGSLDDDIFKDFKKILKEYNGNLPT